MKKLLPPTLFLIFILLMGLLAGSDLCQTAIYYPYVFLGILPLIGGLYLSSDNSRLFKELDANIMTFDVPTKLITEGAFQYSRNPMYLGFVTALSGFAILFGASLGQWLMVFLFWLITDRWYIRFEESAMQHRFGEAYLDYKRSVRRWI